MPAPAAISICLLGATGLWLLLPQRVTGSGRVLDRSAAVRDHLVSRLSESAPLGARLAITGEGTPFAFRSRQISLSAIAALAVASTGLISNARGGSISLGSLPLTAVLAGSAVFAGLDLSLTARTRRRQSEVASQVSGIADLVCLGVVAGESLRSALLRASAENSGLLSEELRASLETVTTGVPLVKSLETLATKFSVPPLTRLVSALTLAHDRGTPLAEQLQAITTEIRSEERRRLIEASGKSQTRMLIPVVTLILPTALAFAFFPGFVALRAFVP
ncbi:MAG: hypothetical protein DCC49_07205 [Acidobacteria bacterium]|nr:MAG: hypothetical protein DCC49_07205 [Acidobacteriota bacterium]